MSDGTHLALVEEVTAEGEHLPQGELVLRMGEISNGNTLLSVCFEYSGKLTQPKGEVKITLPAELLNGVTLTLLNADDTEIDLPYIVEGENAAFTTGLHRCRASHRADSPDTDSGIIPFPSVFKAVAEYEFCNGRYWCLLQIAKGIGKTKYRGRFMVN